MNKFLVKYDFLTLIDEANIDELTDNNDRVLTDSIDSGVEKVASYIRHRYDYDQVFKVVQPYSATQEKKITTESQYEITESYVTGDLIAFSDLKVYVANTDILPTESPVTEPTKWDVVSYVSEDRVFWEEAAFSETATYTTGQRVSYNDNIYEANTSVSAGTFNPSEWDLLAENNSFFVLNDTAIVGTLPTSTEFTSGDDRNPLIKEITIDVVLYNIHSKISPRAIPDVRRTRYDGFGNLKEGDSAISTLKEIQKGNVTLDLPVIENAPQNTERIPYGNQSSSNYIY